MVHQSKRKKLEFGFMFLVYGLCIALACTLWVHPIKLIGCYLFLSILAILKWHEKADLVSYAVAAVLGPFGEAFIVHYGAWTYTKSSFPIPLWLPLLWGVAGLFLRRVTYAIMSMRLNRE